MFSMRFNYLNALWDWVMAREVYTWQKQEVEEEGYYEYLKKCIQIALPN